MSSCYALFDNMIFSARLTTASFSMAAKLIADFLNPVPARRHSFNQPMACSTRLRGIEVFSLLLDADPVITGLSHCESCTCPAVISTAAACRSG